MKQETFRLNHSEENYIQLSNKINGDESWQERKRYYRILQSVRGMIDGANLGSSHIVEINEKELKEMLGEV